MPDEQEIEISDEAIAKQIFTDLQACGDTRSRSKYIAEALGQMQIQIILTGRYASYIAEWIAGNVPSNKRPFTAEEYVASQTMDREKFTEFMTERKKESQASQRKIILL